jgi:hypothetical protein
MRLAHEFVADAPQRPAASVQTGRAVAPAALTPDGMLALQRSAGNRAATRAVRSLQRFHLPHQTPAGVTHPDDETSLIAPTFQDMLGTLRALIDAAVSWGSTVNMDKLIKSVGGQTALDKVNMDSSTKGSPAFRNRYLFTSRCGLIDMLHFLEMLYIAHFLEGQSVDPNRAATRMGREHELASEHGSAAESRFGAEDTTSNALGAFTARGLAAIPQADDLFDAIKGTLERCDPVGFTSLSASSRSTVTHFYGDLVRDPDSPGDLIPKHQSSAAAPLLIDIPELRGRERSFPFRLDFDDPDFKTIAGRAFAKGSVDAQSGRDIRRFVNGQRLEVLKLMSTEEKFRMLRVLLGDDVSSDDIEAANRLNKALTADEKSQWQKELPLLK